MLLQKKALQKKALQKKALDFCLENQSCDRRESPLRSTCLAEKNFADEILGLLEKRNKIWRYGRS